MRSAITAIAGAVILRCMVMTAIEDEMPAMATDAARKPLQLSNAKCCNYIWSRRAHTSRRRDVTIAVGCGVWFVGCGCGVCGVRCEV